MVTGPSKDVEREAAKWFVRWSDASEPVGAKEQSRWIAWLQRSPRHVAEYFTLDDLWNRLAESETIRDFDVDAWMGQRRAPVINLKVTPLTRALPEASTPARPAWARWVAAAAIATVVLGAAIFWKLSVSSDAYRTARGEQKTVQLADGSLLKLNTQSEARVRFDEQAREIELKGEALFTVAHDARRPFVVHVGEATVRAIGTQFNVYEQENGVRVAVLEGRVRLSSDALGKSFDLGAGEEARVIDGVPRKEVKPDVKAATAWRDRTLVFERARLAEVAHEFNRYNTMQFRVDPALDDSHRLSGTFDARHPESLLLWLQSRPDIAVTAGEGDVYFVREDSAQ